MEYVRLGRTGLKVSRICLGSIIGASKAGHIEDAVAALSLQLTGDEVAALEAPYVPHAVAGFS